MNAKSDFLRFRAGCIATAILCGVTGGSRPLHAQTTEYTFTRIADTVTNADAGLDGVFCVGMNNLGVVVVDTGGTGTHQIWRGDGQPQSFTQVLGQNAGGFCSSINDTDEVAYLLYNPATAVTSLVRNSNGILTILARSDVSPFLFSGTTYLPSLSNSGDAVFLASGGAGIGAGIYIGPGGTAVVNTVTNPDLQGWSTASMNESLVVTFSALRVDNINGSRWGVYRGSGVPLIEDEDTVAGGTIRVGTSRPVINNTGTVAFLGSLNGVSGAYTTDDGFSVTLVGTSVVDRISINDTGAVVFRKTLSGGAGSGIYLGRPGLINQTVIAQGDDLDGSKLVNAFIWEESINNRGQVAFWAALEDGRRGVYRADPVNHPPVAEDGTLHTLEDTQASGALGATDADGDSLTYRIVTNGAKGVATVTNPSTGAFSYVPNPNENGADSFSFEVSDGQDDSNIATVSVNIAPVNDAPAAADGVALLNAGASIQGTLVATDIDSAGLTYGIVANGTQGTAVINNAATGAYTYTANIASSGTDTFTFTANDGFLDSNVATVTVTIQAASCATNVSASVSSTLGNVRLDRKSGHYLQKVTLKNTSGNAITGPVSFVLDSLTSGTTVVGSTGVTSCAAPAGSPYVTVNVGGDGILSTRERANVSLEFTLEFANPAASAITYVPRVLAGAGQR